MDQLKKYLLYSLLTKKIPYLGPGWQSSGGLVLNPDPFLVTVGFPSVKKPWVGSKWRWGVRCWDRGPCQLHTRQAGPICLASGSGLEQLSTGTHTQTHVTSANNVTIIRQHMSLWRLWLQTFSHYLTQYTALMLPILCFSFQVFTDRSLSTVYETA